MVVKITLVAEQEIHCEWVKVEMKKLTVMNNHEGRAWERSHGDLSWW